MSAARIVARSGHRVAGIDRDGILLISPNGTRLAPLGVGGDVQTPASERPCGSIARIGRSYHRPSFPQMKPSPGRERAGKECCYPSRVPLRGGRVAYQAPAPFHRRGSVPGPSPISSPGWGFGFQASRLA
jgi:hypothetical protein